MESTVVPLVESRLNEDYTTLMTPIFGAAEIYGPAICSPGIPTPPARPRYRVLSLENLDDRRKQRHQSSPRFLLILSE